MAAQERKINSRSTIAVVGDSPFAAFLAGLLAAERERDVTLVASAPSPLHLPRAPAISIAPLLRPESWRLLLDTTPEALRHLSRIGPRVSVRTDVVLSAAGPSQAHALEHVRHLAAGFDRMIEPAVPAPAGFDAAYRIRDSHRLLEAPFRAALPDWLARRNVTVIPPGEPLDLRRNGSAMIGERKIDHVVLADEAAIADHCPPYDLGTIAHRIAATAFRTEPVAPLADPVLLSMAGDFTLTQTPEGALDIIAYGAPAEAARRAGRFMSNTADARLAAQATFETLVPRDGAPVIGQLRQSRATVVLGLGPLAIFLAPVIARLVADQAATAERSWAEARRPNRNFNRSSVSEYVREVVA
ncbi:hypothetical protein [Pelagibacterium halotolerans]|uniref:hypothetical protein n=1 Tax=Pelagibacterium halotolerans TaxID=531813 RepID=UPI00384D731E